jgi:hypothetical protein
MTDAATLDRVRDMRGRGCTPKQIARALGMRPAQVAGLVRQAAADAAGRPPAQRTLLGCWVSPGWSAGLGLDSAAEFVQSHADSRDRPEGGLAAVLIARQDRGGRAAVCGFLVYVYCLGAKNALGPRIMDARAVDDFVATFFATFPGDPLPVPLAVAQHLVHDAVAYARGLGFEPCADFGTAVEYLGEPELPGAGIRFGREGVPFYFAGPYDDTPAVLATLEETVGHGNYHYVVGTPL